MKFFINLVLLFIVIGNGAFSFEWKKCRAQDWMAGFEPFNVFTASSQFSTSTGGCAMIGQVDHDKKVFIAHNAEFLQIDIARGAGEYLHNFANIFKCNESKLKPILKKDYSAFSLVMNSILN